MFKFATTKALIVGSALLLPASFALAASSSDRGGKLPKADADFIKDAAQDGMMEVELGKIAADKASNSQVKDFGKRMQQDHSKANDELKSIASKKGVQLPSKEHTGKWTSDKAYMDMMVKDHEKDLAEFKEEASSGSDPDVKKFADDTAKIVQEHLDLAKETLGKLK